ncbi:MAG: T9SS type A sorting domain-containing protein [Saprospiraceae bacterium]|nr:T9SS type A sorting domain-containing protein [Saprospiraceae bacterium]MBK7737217.1 T9SS type A sorting domain-containing protein [Saprospiraceae bacterium]
MKKIIIILIFGFITNLISAHDLHYENVIFKKWNIECVNLKIEGSFYLLKDGKVFIESANDKIVTYPIEFFSKKDQDYILQINERILRLNNKIFYSKSELVHDSSFINYQFWIIFTLLSVLSFIIFLFAEKIKLIYLVLIFLSGISILLSSFTTKMLKAMLTPFSPSSIDSAFIPFKPNVHTFWDATYFYVESKGIPTTHNMMVGISNHGWQQQVPIPQCYIETNAWPIPLNPVFASNPIPVDSIHFTRGAIAIAVNGVPIFNVHTNTGVDSYLDGQLDNYGGHCGRADDYHYHIAPLHLYNHTTLNLPIAFGLDGYAVYGSVEPDGTPMQALDANHGHFHNGDYHYHGTVSSPYMIARMAGQVTEDVTHQLIPQAAARPVRPSLTPLNGALITSCTPNSNNNGFNLTYTRFGLTDSVVYSWTPTGQYNFKFYTNGNLDSTKNYKGFVQCTIPITTKIDESFILASDGLIFPNPNNGSFHLKLNGDFDQKNVKLISIFNLNGEIVFQIKQFEPEIEIKHFPKGIYFLQIQLLNTQFTSKIIVQ